MTTTTTRERRRELAHRTADGLDVSLFWSKPTNQLTLEIVDTRFGASFHLDVDGRGALDAFYHPYAYISDAEPGPVGSELQDRG